MKNIKRRTSLVSGIYCIINLVNSKIYVGSTYLIYKRLREHLGLLRNNKHHSKHLQYSFNKYGEEQFYSIILEVCNISILEQREEYWINLLKADYNQILTNLSRPALSYSTEQKEQVSNKLKEAHKSGKFNNKKHKIYVYTLEGCFIKEYESKKLCAKELKMNISNIHDYFKGKINQCKGFQFRLEYRESIPKVDKSVSHSEERRRNQSEKMKGHTINNGRKLTKESIEKRTITRRNNKIIVEEVLEVKEEVNEYQA